MRPAASRLPPPHASLTRRALLRAGLAGYAATWTLGCDAEAPPPPALAAPARRVAALTCAAVDVFAALGALDAVVAVEEDCPLPEAAGKLRVRNDDQGGRSRALNVEALAAARPDAIVAKADLVAALKPLGVPIVLAPSPATLDAIPAFTTALAALTGRPEAGVREVARFHDELRALRESARPTPPVRTAFETTSAWRTLGARSVGDGLIRACGGIGVGSGEDRADVALTAEAWLAFAPELIVLGPFADPLDAVLARPGMSSVPAVRRGMVRRVAPERRRLLLATPRAPAAAAEDLRRWIAEAAAARESGR